MIDGGITDVMSKYYRKGCGSKVQVGGVIRERWKVSPDKKLSIVDC
jgi:hypothetical protein